MKENKFSAKFIFLAILFLAALIYSCNNSITNPVTETVTTDFPNKIGDEWKYFYYDSLSSSADTVIVSIVGDTTFNVNRTAKVWKYRFRNGIEYHFVEILNDTIRIYDALTQQWLNTKFVFPLKLNKGWHGDFLNDSSSVTHIGTINIFAGNFENSYLIHETWNLLNSYGSIFTDFVPGIGIVRKHIIGFAVNNYWELMEYKIE